MTQYSQPNYAMHGRHASPSFNTGSTTPTCPAVTTAGYNCTTTSPNCTGMTCQGPSTDTLMSATASISLQSCDDPPLITLEAWGVFANNSRFNFTHRFQRSESVFIGGANIGATVQRNLTSLQFSVSSRSLSLCLVIIVTPLRACLQPSV